MIADHRADEIGEQDHRSDVKARLLRDLAIDLELALDHDDAVQPGPVVAFLQLGHIVDRNIVSRFDAPEFAIKRLAPADRRVLETIGFLLSGEQLYVFMQRSLIALERNDVNSFLSMIFLAMLRWRSMASIVTTASSIAIRSSSAGDGDDLVGFFGHRDLPEDETLGAAKADTIWIGSFDPFFLYGRREVFPSIAMTSTESLVSAETQETKQR
jgi:hypothetical protein